MCVASDVRTLRADMYVASDVRTVRADVYVAGLFPVCLVCILIAVRSVSLSVSDDVWL